MGEANFSGGSQKIRSVLGDVTNLLGKRGPPSILGNFYKNSGYGNCEKVDNKKEKGKIGAKECVLVNDKENNKRPRPCIQINSLKGNLVSGISKISDEIKDPKEDFISVISKIPCENKDPNLVESGLGNDVIQNSAQAVDVSSCEDDLSRPTSLTGTDCTGVEITCDSYDETIVISREIQADDAQASQNDENDQGADNLVMSQTGSVDGARFPESQESTCAGMKADGCSNLSAIDSIKSCSCSFCRKAAYVWLDLHYQDMKGRITAIRKSQKDASILVERTCKSRGTEKHVMGSSSRESKLEYDLRSQWRSLFLQMEEKFEHEGNQLESSLLSLRDLREKCKTELEAINGTRAEEQ